MNKKFVEEYYDLKYPDTYIETAEEQDEKFKSMGQEVMLLKGQVEDVMGKQGKEALRLCEKLFEAESRYNELLVRLAYLQGARDKEKMLE
ncbi:MAG: hypothetical protein HFJ05_09040 [Eubacterium sp.]|nr:hypothetical protein [Eubacterium sp.]